MTIEIDSAVKACAAPKIRVFRKAFIKRRLFSTGLYESDWLEITSDVKKWGSIRMSTDSERPGRLTIEGMRLVLHNDFGKYNPNDDINSLWFGYLDQQRTLAKIETGFYVDEQGSDLIWTRAYLPGLGQWDAASWDEDSFDANPQVFTGIISGELSLSDRNEVTIQLKPLNQVFKDYPAANLSGYGPSLTASGFIQLLRDQTDGSGSFIFRPFFGETTSFWDISATSNVYADLNTSTAKDVRDSTCWEIVEKLAEAENYTAYVDQRGTFHFIPRTAGNDIAFEFHGLGSFNTEFGHTIKSITRYGVDYNRYYSRVQVRYREPDTSTSYVTVQSTFAVSPTNTPWQLGHKTFQLENYWIPTATSAESIATNIFNDLSALKKTIEFTTSFVPHLNLNDRVAISYDSTTRAQSETLWDSNDWDTELTFDSSRGDAIVLDASEFRFQNIEINLDTFECKFIAREI